MLATIQRKIHDRRRALARGPLTDLVLWVGHHAMRPYTGASIETSLMLTLEREVMAGLHQLADTGVLAYFGIRDSAELGDPPVRVDVIASPPPWGQTEVWAPPIVEWIMNGGARARGWMSPRSFTDDLLR